MEININRHSEYIFGAVPDDNPEHAFTRMGVNDFWGSPNSTGVRIKFRTNSQTVSIKMNIKYAEVEAFFGSMMVNGITYIIKNPKKVLKMECVSGRNQGIQTLYRQTGNDFLDYEIYCPVKNTLISMDIYVDDGSEIISFDKINSPILFLGGPTAFGRGCTFPHGMYSSIVARKLSLDYYNLAIYNSRYLEEKYVLNASKAIQSPRFVVAEICSIPTTKEYISEKLSKYLETLADSFPRCPIVLFSQPYDGRKLDNYIECAKIISAFAKKYPSRNIMYLDGKTVFSHIPTDRVTISSYLINDYGNMILADRIIKIAEAFVSPL